MYAREGRGGGYDWCIHKHTEKEEVTSSFIHMQNEFLLKTKKQLDLKKHKCTGLVKQFTRYYRLQD